MNQFLVPIDGPGEPHTMTIRCFGAALGATCNLPVRTVPAFVFTQISAAKLKIALVVAAFACLALCSQARAACVTPTGSATFLGSYTNTTNNTDSAKEKYGIYQLGAHVGGETIIVGFIGLGQSVGSGDTDTYLRLFDDYGEVAYNDNACGTLASRIVYNLNYAQTSLSCAAFDAMMGSPSFSSCY